MSVTARVAFEHYNRLGIPPQELFRQAANQLTRRGKSDLELGALTLIALRTELESDVKAEYIRILDRQWELLAEVRP